MNEAQREAVATTEGPVLLIAGPGTGKTYTLVERIVHLLVDRDVPPEAVLVTTFTRKAALELQTRITASLEKRGRQISLQDMHIGTMHAVFLRILQSYRQQSGLRRDSRLADDFELHYRMSEWLDEFLAVPDAYPLAVKDNDREGPTPQKMSARLIHWMNKLSDENVDIERLASSEDATLRAMAAVYRLYARKLEACGLIDFGLIQTRLLRLFENYPDVLEALRDKFRYIMIDEYQDTSAVQERLIRELAGSRGNVCVVGDDDQAIYRFRGATAQNLIQFRELYPMCRVIQLKINYRSHPRIVKFYQAWMALCDWESGQAKYRLDKRMETHKDDSGRTTRVLKCAGAGGVSDWLSQTAKLLAELKEGGVIEDWNQVAFLFRSVRNRDVQKLADYLEERGVPVYAPRMGRFFEREEVTLVLGALVAVLLPSLTAELPPYFQGAMRRFAAAAADKRELTDWVREQRGLYAAGQAAPETLFYRLLGLSEFARFVADDYIDNARDSRVVRNVAALSSWMAKLGALHPSDSSSPEEAADAFVRFFAFIRERGEHEYEDEADYAPAGSVSFMTFHQSKGLEFPIVVAGSLDATPYPEADLTEAALRAFYDRRPFEPPERTAGFDFYRLYYTAFSRAQELLILTCAEQQGDYQGRYEAPSVPFKPLYRVLADWRDPRVNLRELKLARIKRMELLDAYAYTSHVQLYERCPRQYLFVRQYGFAADAGEAADFGNLVHHTIEDLHLSLLRGEAADEERLRRWLLANAEAAAGGEGAGGPDVERAGEHVLRYYRQLRAWSPTVEGVEALVYQAQSGYILNGKVDALLRLPDGSLHIVDLKTGRVPDGEEQLARYKKQLYLYVYLLSGKLGEPIAAAHLFFSAEERESLRTFAVSGAELSASMDDIRRTIAAIRHGDFRLRQYPVAACAACAFQPYCAGRQAEDGGRRLA